MATATTSANASVPLPVVQTAILTFHAVGTPQKVIDYDLKRYVCQTEVTGNLSTTSLVGLLPVKAPMGQEKISIPDERGDNVVKTDWKGNFSFTTETPLHLFPAPVCSVDETAADGVTASFAGILSPIVVGGASTPLAAT